METDVVVVGAGPTGLALACGLLIGGASVRVVDRAAEAATTSRASGLQARGVEILRRLGALSDLPTRGLPIHQVNAYVDGKHAGTLDLGVRTRLYTQPGVLVSQAMVEGQLRERLAELGGKVEWDSEASALDQDEDGVTVHTAAGTTIRAKWLVGCDGGHSQIRKLTGTAFRGVPLMENFLLADVRADLPISRNSVSVWLRGEQMLGVFPLPGKNIWRLMAPSASNGEIARTPDEVLAALRGLMADLAGLPAAAIEEGQWMTTFRIQRRLVDDYRTGRVLLAGDAAHIHSPLGGQGMNTGLGDADNLAWKLSSVIAGQAKPALLDTYQAERRPVAERVLSATSSQSNLVVGTSLFARLLRDWVLAPALDLPFVRRQIAEATSQLRLSYRKGPLALRGAGGRVPDRPCVRADGMPSSLHRELAYGWAIVVPDTAAGKACVVTARRRLGADNLQVLTASGPEVLLVRPDWHLGWRGRPAPAPLGRWLDSALDRGRAERI